MTRSLSRSTAESVGGGVFNQFFPRLTAPRSAEEIVPQMMYAAVLPYLGPEAARRSFVSRHRRPGG